MKVLRIAAPALLMLAAGAAPVLCGDLLRTPQMVIRADVAPTLDQVRGQLALTRVELRQAELASFYSPTAEADYRAAQIATANGQYGRAMENLSLVRASVAGIPNWKSKSSRFYDWKAPQVYPR